MWPNSSQKSSSSVKVNILFSYINLVRKLVMWISRCSAFNCEAWTPPVSFMCAILARTCRCDLEKSEFAWFIYLFVAGAKMLLECVQG